MTTDQLMKTLVEHKRAMVDALALSLRNIKYGKEGSGFYSSAEELLASLQFLFDLSEDCKRVEYKIKKQIIDNWKSTDELNTDDLKRFRFAVYEEVEVLLDLLANINKAEESIVAMKGVKDGNCEERHDTCEDI